jgi:hypothetical protein
MTVLDLLSGVWARLLGREQPEYPDSALWDKLGEDSKKAEAAIDYQKWLSEEL